MSNFVWRDRSKQWIEEKTKRIREWAWMAGNANVIAAEEEKKRKCNNKKDTRRNMVEGGFDGLASWNCRRRRRESHFEIGQRSERMSASFSLFRNDDDLLVWGVDLLASVSTVIYSLKIEKQGFSSSAVRRCLHQDDEPSHLHLLLTIVDRGVTSNCRAPEMKW